MVVVTKLVMVLPQNSWPVLVLIYLFVDVLLVVLFVFDPEMKNSDFLMEFNMGNFNFYVLPPLGNFQTRLPGLFP